MINASSFNQPLQGGVVVPYQPMLHSVIHHRLRIVLGSGESKLGNELHVLVDVGSDNVCQQSRIDNNLGLTSWWNNSCIDVTMKISDKMGLDSNTKEIPKQQEVNSITFGEWVVRFIFNRIVILILFTISHKI